MGVVSFNWWVWPVPGLYFQKLEPMAKHSEEAEEAVPAGEKEIKFFRFERWL